MERQDLSCTYLAHHELESIGFVRKLLPSLLLLLLLLLFLLLVLHAACRYAFLIDSNGLVRWRGSGMAEQSEVEGLLRAADQLLNST